VHIAILGIGNMGRALLNGITLAGTASSITVWDAKSDALNSLPETTTSVDPAKWEKLDAIDVVIIAVKPDRIREALSPFAPQLAKKHAPLWLSVAAGISMDVLCTHIGEKAPVCRAMPNTPALIGMGYTALCFNENAGKKQKDMALSIAQVLGEVQVLQEDKIDAITAVSGSGPAYVYVLLEAFVDAAVHAGLSRDIAKKAVLQTFAGSLALIEKYKKSEFSELRAQVTSPGGTTAEGVSALERGAIRSTIDQAVASALARARQMGSSAKT